MTREEAKDFLFDMFDLIGTTAIEYWTEKDAEKMRQAVLTIENESAQPEQHWIPCSERLPEEIEKDYWVCTDEDHHNWQCVCKWRKYPSRRGDFWTWHLNARVVAWMPLPEPYREERRTDEGD